MGQNSGDYCWPGSTGHLSRQHPGLGCSESRLSQCDTGLQCLLCLRMGLEGSQVSTLNRDMSCVVKGVQDEDKTEGFKRELRRRTAGSRRASAAHMLYLRPPLVL